MWKELYVLIARKYFIFSEIENINLSITLQGW